MLNEKQRAMISELVAGERGVVEICNSLEIPTSTYYWWRNNSDEFIKALDEAIELKVQEAKKEIKMDVKKYIKRLDELSKSSKNDMAKINAVTKLLDLAQLFENKSEITVKSDLNSEEKNHLLDLLGYETSNSQNSQDENEDSQE